MLIVDLFEPFSLCFFFLVLNQDQVSGSTTSTVLKNLDSDTEYTVTVVPVYPEMEGKSQSENGKTCERTCLCLQMMSLCLWHFYSLHSTNPYSSVPLGGVKNLQVIDPTFNTLKVRWEPAVGNVRSYKVLYAAQPGGEERTVWQSFKLPALKLKKHSFHFLFFFLLVSHRFSHRLACSL